MKTSKPKPVRAGAATAVPAALKPLIQALSPETGVTVEKGWGSSSVVLKARGKIFVMLVNDELVLKLPKSRVDELVDGSVGRRFDPRRDGRLMKEWIVLSAPKASWLELAREAFRFVSAAGR
jgi:hypothetical protein